jgi:hypothetical protein
MRTVVTPTQMFDTFVWAIPATLLKGKMPPSRRRIIGLVGAALWLIVASGAFLMLSLWMIGTAAAWQLLFIATGITAVLVAIGLRVLNGVLRLPGAMPPRTPEERAVFRRFVRVVVAEVAAFMLVNSVCVTLQHVEFIVPLDVVIVGIHFLPLARIFRVPRYYPLGVLFCSVAILTLLMFRGGAHVGHAIAWYVVPSLGCAPVAWVTAGAGLREAWQAMVGLRPSLRGDLGNVDNTN